MNGTSLIDEEKLLIQETTAKYHNGEINSKQVVHSLYGIFERLMLLAIQKRSEQFQEEIKQFVDVRDLPLYSESVSIKLPVGDGDVPFPIPRRKYNVEKCN